MAYRSQGWGYNAPTKDTGWGLIFRLNLLLGKIEKDVEVGNLDMWNLRIDRIFANISHKNPAEVIYDKDPVIFPDAKPIDISFSAEDIGVFKMFAEKIEKIKEARKKALKYQDDEYRAAQMAKIKKAFYNIIFKKDIWIRKKMADRKLYLQQIEHDPSKAIYGG